MNAASTFVLGTPAAVQTQFVVEGALNRVLPQAEAHVEELLTKLDAIEQQLFDDMPNLAVEEIGEIKVRNDEFQQLLLRYKFWQGELANALGCFPNPFDNRVHLRVGAGGGVSNMPVNN